MAQIEVYKLNHKYTNTVEPQINGLSLVEVDPIIISEVKINLAWVRNKSLFQRVPYQRFHCTMVLFILFQVSLKSEDYGKHLLGVQDLLQKHSLTEANITTQTDRAKALKVH